MDRPHGSASPQLCSRGFQVGCIESCCDNGILARRHHASQVEHHVGWVLGWLNPQELSNVAHLLLHAGQLAFVTALHPEYSPECVESGGPASLLTIFPLTSATHGRPAGCTAIRLCALSLVLVFAFYPPIRVKSLCQRAARMISIFSANDPLTTSVTVTPIAV